MAGRRSITFMFTCSAAAPCFGRRDSYSSLLMLLTI
jgi:hypothetical protein